MKKHISILGSTGSIGVNALKIVDSLNQEINVQSKVIVLLDYKILGNESEEA